MISPKSAMTAGILGIVLGVFGVHDWYLDRFKQAKLHVYLVVAGAILFAVSLISHSWIGSSGSQTFATIMNSIATTTRVMAWLTIGISAVWGIIEAILILAQGDAGLVAQGYTIIQKAPQPAEEVEPEPESGLIPMEGMPAGSVVLPAKPKPAPPVQAAQSPQLVQPLQVQQQAVSPLQTMQPTAGQITLPPSPTLAEQASNTNAAPQPIVFRASDIDPQNAATIPDQTLSTKNVTPPPLTVNIKNGVKMNPVVVRRLAIGGVVAVAAIVLIFMIRNGVVSVIAAGYGESYRAAKELSGRLTKVHESSGCKFAVDYVQSAFVDTKTYNEYVNSCIDLSKGMADLVEKLGNSPAVKWSSTINGQFQGFQRLYNDTLPKNNDALVTNLDLYLVWHNYVIMADRLAVDSSEAEFQQAADILRKSGNKILAQYGEEWLQKEMEYLQLYRTYWDTSYEDANKETLRAEVEAKRAELQNWVDDHRPDVAKMAPVYVPETEAVYNSFTKLYDMIKEGYQDNYDYDSKDCTTAGKNVYCS